MAYWGKNEELMSACTRFQISDYGPPEKYSYTPFPSILQDGPQCGLIALAMYCNFTSKEKMDEILNTAKELNFTNNGEMFNAENMCDLTKQFTDKVVELYTGSLLTDRIKDFLLNEGVMLVPYDSDANHSPCTKNGHKAHWALISGIIISNQTYLISRQGKSKHLGIWALEEWAQSNSQLNEFSPSRKESNLEYKLPEGGISGPRGLKNKSVLIHS